MASALARSGSGVMTHLFYDESSRGFGVENFPDDKIPDAILMDPRVDYIEPALQLTVEGSPPTVSAMALG